METLDLLQNLVKERDELIKVVDAQEETLQSKLYDLFTSLSEYEGLTMMPLACNIERPWNLSKKNTSSFEVTTSVEFYNENGDKWPSGQIKADFGSDISLYIYEDHIEMNYGTCGQYSSKDKGQMSRAMFVPELWKHESQICSICKSIININDYDHLLQVRHQISTIENDIKQAERDREKQEIIDKIKKAKFICKRRIADDGYWDDNNKYIVKKKFYVYHSFETIKKVTDKSVITIDEYWRDNHRHDLNSIVADIREGVLFLQTERIATEDIPSEETSTD